MTWNIYETFMKSYTQYVINILENKKKSQNHKILKAHLYKYVFNRSLKTDTQSDDLISTGKLFHSFGALTANALSPFVLCLVLGTASNSLKDDLRHLPVSYSFRSSVKYKGAMPFKALYVNKIILKSILKSTGNQCKEAKTGVIWWYNFVRVNSLAAAFCTNCKRDKLRWFKEEIKALQ